MLNTMGRLGTLLFLVLAPIKAEELSVENFSAEEAQEKIDDVEPTPTLTAAKILAEETIENDAALEIKSAANGSIGTRPCAETLQPADSTWDDDSEVMESDVEDSEIKETHPQLAKVGAWLANEPEPIEYTDPATYQLNPNLLKIFPVKSGRRWQFAVIPLTVLLIAYLIKIFQAPGRQQEAKMLPGPMGKRVTVQVGKDTEKALRKMSARPRIPKVKV